MLVCVLAAALSGAPVREDKTLPGERDERSGEMTGIARMLLFHMNIQRVVRGHAPVLLDPVLEQAALWQAKYCASMKKATGRSKEKGMETLQARVRHFQGNCGRYCAENIYRLDARRSRLPEGAPDRTIAYSLLGQMMRYPDLSGNIMRKGFNVAGAGVVGTGAKGDEVYFCSQVFDARPVVGKYHEFRSLEAYEKASADSLYEEPVFVERSVRRIREEGKARDAVIFTIHYGGRGELKIIQVRGDSEVKYYPLKKIDGGRYEYERRKDHVIYIFVAVQEPGGMLYPLKNIW